MIETIHRHSRLHRNLMLDWLRECEDSKAPFPRDADVAARFGYESIEAARTLLADLADEKAITIERESYGIRIIALGSAKPALAPKAARPIKPIVHPTTPRRPKEPISLEEGIDRALKAMRENRKPSPPAPQPRLRIVTPEPSEPIEVDSSKAYQPTPPYPPPAARIREQPPAPKKIGRPFKERRLGEKMMFRVYPETHDALVAIANARGEPMVTVIREIVEEATARKPVVPLPCKPTVPVAVLLASIEAGRGLHEFVAELIELGLATWRADQEEAAA